MPVSIPIATVGVAEVDAKATVGISANPGNVHATISVDICASIAVVGGYCGKDLLPGVCRCTTSTVTACLPGTPRRN